MTGATTPMQRAWGLGWPAVLAAAAMLALTTGAAAQRVVGKSGPAPYGPPLYAALELSGNFDPDPVTVEVEAGGDDDAASLGAGCSGRIGTDAPDVTIRFSNPVRPLILYVLSEADTTLVVRRPNGSWACDDDSHGLNPMVTLAKPASGEYAVWIGLHGDGFAEATLHVSEFEPDWGDAPAQPEREPEPILLEVAAGSRAEPVATALVDAVRRLHEQMFPEPALHLSGPVRATDEGERIRVVFPGLGLSEDDTRLVVGDVVVDLTPRGADRYHVTIGLPQRFDVLGDSGRIGLVDIGAARLAGEWSVGLATMPVLDVELRDVALSEFDDKGAATVVARLARLAVSQALAAGADGLWSGPYAMTVAGLDIGDDSDRMTLGEFAMAGRYDGVDLDGAASLAARHGLLDPASSNTTGAGEAEEADIAAFLRDLGGLRWGRVESSLSLRALALTEGGVRVFEQDGLRLHGAIDARGDLGSIGFGLEVEGMTLDLDQVPDALRPRRFAVDLTLERLPLKALVSQVLPAELAADAPGSDRLLAALGAAGPSLAIPRLLVETGVLAIRGGGAFALGAGSELGEGGFELRVRGLGPAIDAVVASGDSLPGAKEALPVLLVFQGLARAESVDGTVEHVFALRSTAAGVITVNGVDWNDILR